MTNLMVVQHVDVEHYTWRIPAGKMYNIKFNKVIYEGDIKRKLWTNKSFV